MLWHKIFNGALNSMMIFRNMRNPTLKYLNSWNLRPKPDLAIRFWASLLRIGIEDPILIYFIWVFNTTIEVAMKKHPIWTTL